MGVRMGLGDHQTLGRRGVDRARPTLSRAAGALPRGLTTPLLLLALSIKRLLMSQADKMTATEVGLQPQRPLRDSSPGCRSTVGRTKNRPWGRGSWGSGLAPGSVRAGSHWPVSGLS